MPSKIPPKSAPKLPAKMGRYEVLEQIGKGAMGVVYLARDPLIGRLVALKTFRLGYALGDDELDQFRTRFIREAQSCGILNHPNIVTIHDVVELPEEGSIFIAMEYAKGLNLKMLLKKSGGLPLEFVVDVVSQVAGALDYAHANSVIHRDIKPANIILTEDHLAKITDFGIARMDASNLTQDGQMLGTPNYMAPEQVQGGNVDHRADLFSLGIVLYEMLTQEKPFQGDNLTVVSHRIVYGDYTPVEEHLDQVPAGLDELLTRALAKDPGDRFQRGAELVQELEQVLSRSQPASLLYERAPQGHTWPVPGGAKAGREGAGPEPGTAQTGRITGKDRPPRKRGSETWISHVEGAGVSAPDGDSEGGGSGTGTGAREATADRSATVFTGTGTGSQTTFFPEELSGELPEGLSSLPPTATGAQGKDGLDLTGALSQTLSRIREAGAKIVPPEQRPPKRRLLIYAAAAVALLLFGSVVLALLRGRINAGSADAQEQQERLRFESSLQGLLVEGSQLLNGEEPAGAVARFRQADAQIEERRRSLEEALESHRETGEEAAAERAVKDLDRLVEREITAESLLERAEWRLEAHELGRLRAAAVEEHLAQAREALDARRFRDARSFAEQALTLDPGAEEGWAIVAEVEPRLARQAEAAAAPKPTPPPPELIAGAPAKLEPVTPDPLPVATDATLVVDFAARLPRGTVMLYLEGERLLREGFKAEGGGLFRRGRQEPATLTRSFKVDAGTQRLTVYVSGAGRGAQTKDLSANFPGGSTRRLVVRVARDGSFTARME